MKLVELKERLPDFSEFSFFKSYGISANCCVQGYYITRPESIQAICCGEKAFFKGTKEGYEKAVKWLEEKRIVWLKKLGVEFENE